MWDVLVKLIVGIFGKVFKSLLDKPIEEKGEYKDVGKKQPENPDDIFDKSDF